VEQARAPFALTTSDGSELPLTRLDARGTVQGGRAFTELHLYFRNPEARVRAGRLAITLPAGAVVERFSTEVDGRCLEAQVVGARRRKDPLGGPASLEDEPRSNTFETRFLPIAPDAHEHVIVSFAQELGETHYALPLRGLPEVGSIDVAIDVTGDDGARSRRSLAGTAWKPDRDFAIGGHSDAIVVPSATPSYDRHLYPSYLGRAPGGQGRLSPPDRHLYPGYLGNAPGGTGRLAAAAPPPRERHLDPITCGRLQLGPPP
jgi:hypothetical protein